MRVAPPRLASLFLGVLLFLDAVFFRGVARRDVFGR
jgi:hypothetical protein